MHLCCEKTLEHSVAFSVSDERAAHDVAPNTTDNPRLAVIFRPTITDPSYRDELLKGK
jgi:hypothetical protein